jgi:hypothetical protein
LKIFLRTGLAPSAVPAKMISKSRPENRFGSVLGVYYFEAVKA